MNFIKKDSSLLNLPVDLWVDIVNELPDSDLAHRIPLICKGFLQLSREEKLWKKRTIQRFGEGEGNPSFEKTQSWKVTFIALHKLEMDKMMKRVRKELEEFGQRVCM